jgi:hypothetical protein
MFVTDDFEAAKQRGPVTVTVLLAADFKKLVDFPRKQHIPSEQTTVLTM